MKNGYEQFSKIDFGNAYRINHLKESLKNSVLPIRIIKCPDKIHNHCFL